MKKILVLIILLGGLYFSSGQTYEQQSLIPSLKKWLPGEPFASLLSSLHIPYWGTTVSVDERGYYPFFEFLLRKSAHFFIFGFIATVIYLVLPKHTFRLMTAAWLTLFVAIGDEYHQSLTGGRTPAVQDVILDMSGAITFLIILKLILFLRRPKKRRRKR